MERRHTNVERIHFLFFVFVKNRGERAHVNTEVMAISNERKVLDAKCINRTRDCVSGATNCVNCFRWAMGEKRNAEMRHDSSRMMNMNTQTHKNVEKEKRNMCVEKSVCVFSNVETKINEPNECTRNATHCQDVRMPNERS